MELHPQTYWLTYLKLVGVCAALLLAQLPLQSSEFNKGIGFISSKLGKVVITDSAGQTIHPELHQSFEPDACTLSTDTESSIFIALSNGIAIGLGPSSKVTINRFEQVPFSAERESRKFEPSRSRLKITLIQGTLSCDYEHLSALSEATILSEAGKLHLHKGQFTFAIKEDSFHAVAFLGNATFYYPTTSVREFLATNQVLTVPFGSSEQGDAQFTETTESIAESWKRQALATQNARKRIYFQAAAENDTIATGNIIVSPQFYKQTPARPYSFQPKHQSK